MLRRGSLAPRDFRLARRGVTHYDFLRGDEVYKENMATESCPLVQVHVYRPSVSTVLHHSVECLLHVMKQMVRSFRRGQSAAV